MKKIISLVVAFMLVFSMSAIAAESDAVKVTADSNITVDAGASFKVNFSLLNAADVKNYVVKDFVFDETVLELVNAEVIEIGDPTLAKWLNGALAVTYSEVQAVCSGPVLSLEFKVNESAKEGTYEIAYTAQVNTKIVAAEAASIVVNPNPNAEEDDVKPDLNEDITPEPEMTSAERGKDVICLKINKSSAYAFGNMISIDEANEKVVPYIVNDRTLVPLRFVSETLGADVLWEDGWEYCYVNKGDKKIKITFGSADIEVNGKVVTYEAPVEVVEDRTMVPVRFISEELGYHVYWNEPNEAVVITPIDNPWVDTRKAENSLLMDIFVTFLLAGKN